MVRSVLNGLAAGVFLLYIICIYIYNNIFYSMMQQAIISDQH